MKTIIIVYGGSESERLEFLRAKNCEAFLDIYKDTVEKTKDLLINNDVIGVEGGSAITLPAFFLGLYQRLESAELYIYSIKSGVAVLSAIKTHTLEDTYAALCDFVQSSKHHIIGARKGAEPAEQFLYMPYEFIKGLREYFNAKIGGPGVKSLLNTNSVLSTRFMNIQVLPGHTANVVLDAYDPFKEQRFTFELIIYKPVYALEK